MTGVEATGAQVDALVAAVEAAGAGVAFDGLSVSRGADGYALTAPGTGRRGLSAAELREALRDLPALVTNWHFFERVLDTSPARRAFLRWIERAGERGVRERYADLGEGAVRRWGQLAITVRLRRDGARAYDLRHGDDLGADPADLESHDDPLDARRIATFDDRGRYRPLKAAPTLRTGWVFEGLDPRGLVRAVDFLYPATVENWHLEREGDLDVTHWRETAERQTGIYGAVSELPDEAVPWAAAACCVDSQCLKRRRWDLDGETELGVERGDGAFPCREPCSLFVAAAREWALLEREEARTYEVELTPGERDQVREIVAAVAEGRIDEIREADLDDPANRYRARYLRAKRFDGADDE